MKQTTNKTKIYTKPFLVIGLCIAMAYTSCRKTENSPQPASANMNYAEIGSQIARNLSQSVSGGFGGVNLMDGVDSVSFSGHYGPHHDLNANLLCGFYTDSVVNFNKKTGDTTSHTGGDLTFYFNCQNGQANGYTAYDSLATTRTTPTYTDQYYVKQYYTIEALTSDHQFIGVNGDIYFYDQTILKCGCHSVENANYVLKDLKVNVCGCSRDILSGTATFKAYGHNWSLSGSMTFLGNHMADIIFDGNPTVYHINLLTGKVTS
ncbi:MAG: hypothetical protein JST19_18430 [Bacteroidetes bacterium]|nr:hypothetical protein [Bacteroidota bacterium]